MNTHYMKLQAAPYDSIKAGTKIIEVRLFDEKRQSVKVGDIIEFSKLSHLEDSYRVKVKALHNYSSFKELADSFTLSQISSSGETKEDFIRGMYNYYSFENEKKYGVLGIEVELVI